MKPEDKILADIFEYRRDFLPGPEPAESDVRSNLDLPILMGGLDREDAVLILSALPRSATRIYVSPLDKGLSGAKVFSAKYELEGAQAGKVFVLKVGPMSKVHREYDAICTYVLPHIYGVMKPILRSGDSKALIVQEFAGLTGDSSLRSLREYIRDGNNPSAILKVLLRDRLRNWYRPRNIKLRTWTLRELLEWNLSKCADAPVTPESWGNIDGWLLDVAGATASSIASRIAVILDETITSPATVIHGDLHCQNILVDEHVFPWPIDFAWCRKDSSPILDAAMLECSLKFLVIPRRADPRTLLRYELLLAYEPYPDIDVISIPYAAQIAHALEGVRAAREFILEDMGIEFSDYLKTLFALTWTLRNAEGLNQPYLLGALAVLSKVTECAI